MQSLDELRKVLPWCCEYADTDECRKHRSCQEHIADMLDAIEQELAERYVELLVDADGVPIHVGDVMAYADNTKPMEVIALVPPAVFLTEDGPRYADMCRHHHAHTVEDVLTEFAAKLIERGELTNGGAQTIAEYAKRLKLAGEDE